MTKGKAPRERPWVAAGFLLALVIVAALGWLSRQSDRRLQTSETWVAHTQEVLDALESVRSAMLEAQNQGLGYAVTDNGLHAEACGTALSQWSGHLQRLRDLTADNPVQQDRMGRLEALLSQRRLVIERAIARHRKDGDGEAGGQAAALLLDLASPREPAAMLDDMRAEEQRLLKGREAKLLAVQRLATWTQAGGTAVTAALLIALFALSRRENARLHRAEESVLKNEARFRAMIEGMTDYAIIMLDTGGAVVSWNPGAERMTGYQEGEIAGQDFSRLYPPEEAAAGKPQRNLAEVRKDGRFEEEGWRARKDGTRFVANVVITALRDDAGNLLGFAKITRDITERKRAEEELRELNERLERRVEERTRELVAARDAAQEANRAKGEFLANISHEVRTPMNAILGMTDLVLETPLEDNQRRFLATVKESAEALLEVLNDLLDFSRIEAGRFDLDESPFALRKTVEDTVAMLAERAHHKELELSCGIAPDVPDALAGDAGHLRQILVNLIGNAIKFTPRGQIVARVEAEEILEHEVTLRFTISDTGIGIPRDKMALIFEPFRQADASVTREFGGTGLGLAISSQLVRLMHGTIGAESEEGRGSVFHFTARFGLTVAGEAERPAVLKDLRGLPVLVVDDAAVNRQIYGELLTAWGMRPTVAEGGEQALSEAEAALAGGAPFALALLDGQMPGMDGYELAERLRARPELGGPAIVMLTSSGETGDARRWRELGISDCLVKPVRQSDLLNAILRAMGLAACGRSEGDDIPLVRPLKVLLAEDHPANQQLATHILERRGHKVIVAANGQEALDALAREDFDVVLMDIQMPVMDGFAATAALRDPASEVRRHDIPVVAMTAHAMRGDKERCLAAGMDAYVSKPVTPASLMSALAELLGDRNERGVLEPAGGGAPGGSAGVQERGGAEEQAPGAPPRPVSPACAPSSAPAPHPPPDAAVFDRSALLAFLEGDAPSARKIAECFLKGLPSLLANLESAAAEGDLKSLAFHAHALKGSAGTLCGARAQEASHRLMEAAHAGDVAAARVNTGRVRDEARALQQALGAFAAEEA